MNLDSRRLWVLESNLAPAAALGVVEYNLAQQRNITEPRLGSIIDRESFRSSKSAVDQGNVHLQGKATIKGIAADELRDRTVKVLPGRIGYFGSVELERSEMSELLGNGAIESANIRWPAFRNAGHLLDSSREVGSREWLKLRCIAAAQITGPRRRHQLLRCLVHRGESLKFSR